MIIRPTVQLSNGVYAGNPQRPIDLRTIGQALWACKQIFIHVIWQIFRAFTYLISMANKPKNAASNAPEALQILPQSHMMTLFR